MGGCEREVIHADMCLVMAGLQHMRLGSMTLVVRRYENIE